MLTILLDRRAEFTAITRALNLSSVSLPEDGVLRHGTLVARTGDPRHAQTVVGARGGASSAAEVRSAETRPAATDSEVRPSTANAAGDPPSLPRLDARFVEAEDEPEAELELGALLGSGGMGAVHLARQRSLRREVAVKRLRDGSAQKEGLLALLAEARITGALEHPSIVPVHALGLDATGAPLLVMKRVEGATLETLLRDPSHPAWTELSRRHGDRTSAECEVLMRVAEALHFAHDRGYFHRDVKPANIMVGSFGEVYLLDWGVALAAAEASEAVPEIVGTVQYMAPEMVQADPTLVTARTDVYLLGATLHAVLTGEPKHHGESLAMILYAAFESAPYAYPASVPTELAELANASTSADPGERPPTALAFRDALAAFLRHRGARRLSLAAEARLASLRASDEAPSAEVLARPETSLLLGECRFALTQALAEWEGDERARTALRQVLLYSVEAEIQRRSPDGAAAFANDLRPPEPGLDERIAALRREVAEARRLEDAARREEVERDPGLSARFRLPILLVTMGMTVVLFVMAFFEEAHRAAPVSMTLAARGDVMVLGVMASMMLLFRKRLFKNRAGRQLSALFLLSLASSAIGDSIAASRGETSREAGPVSVILIGAVYLGAAIGLGGRLWWGALICFAAGIVGAIWPATATSMVGVGCIGCIGALIYDAVGPPPKSTF